MPGDLIDNKVLISNEAEASQTYNKGYHGKPLPGGGLELTLVEAILLVESSRLEVLKNGRSIDFGRLMRYACTLENEFEIRYLVYRDLRQRGYVVKPDCHPWDFHVLPRGGVPNKNPAQYWVCAFSERSEFVADELRERIGAVSRMKKPLLVGIVDEESDLTYYRVQLKTPKGRVHPKPVVDAADGIFLGDRVVVMGPAEAEMLHDSEFFGKLVGNRLQLSLIETAFLMEQGRLQLKNARSGRTMTLQAFERKANKIQPDFHLRFSVYTDLKQRGMVVKTGFKYGTHFRVYDANPQNHHAKYLVHAVPPKFKSTWPEISRAVRLSHGVKKDILFGSPKDKENKAGVSDYLLLRRVRP